ncbi:MAG: hypothetical protein OXE57_13575 [Alphaproteobacteria bacterium]|nr:hypothetical protein [Alphaproteobacteria bacterium]
MAAAAPAGLSALRGVNAVEPDPLARDGQRIAVKDARRSGEDLGAGGGGEERQEEESGKQGGAA